MRQQDKLRNTLRGYYDSQEVPFNNKDWERASAYIHAARRKRRILYVACILTAAFSTLLISLFTFQKPANGNTQLSLASSKQDIIPTPVPKALAQRVSPVSSPSIKASDKSLPVGKSGQSSGAKSSAPQALKNKPDELSLISGSKSPQVFTSKITKPGVESLKQEENPGVGKPMDTIPLAAGAELAGSPARHYDEQNMPPLEDNRVNPETDAATDTGLLNTQNQSTAKEIVPSPSGVPEQATSPVATPENSMEVSSTGLLKNTEKQENTLVLVTDSAKNTPTSVAISTAVSAGADSASAPGGTNTLAGEGIFYEAGAAWVYGWKGPVHRDARGLSPVAGIHYMNRLGRRSAISFGVRYLQVNGLSGSSKTSRVSSYVYGELSRVTVITPSTLHYLVAPLRFHYYTDKRNCFGAGINLAYLLNVDATVTSYDERPGYTGNYQTIKQGGYTEGFSWYDSQLAFLYRRRIGASLAVQAEVFVGLTDVKQDTFFGINAKEKNSGLTFSLVYYAFRKKDR